MFDRLIRWWTRGQCLFGHAPDPLWDRDAKGRALFRCRACHETWPVLPDLHKRVDIHR